MTRMDKRRQLLKNKRKLFLRCLVALFLMTTFFRQYSVEEAVPAGAMYTGSAVFYGGWREILSQGIPGMSAKEETMRKHTDGGIVNAGIRFFSNIDGADVRSILRAEIPVLALAKSSPKLASEDKPLPKLELAQNIPAGEPIVGIYHTHTAESFIPSSGVAHRPGGTVGEITDVGETLVNTLAKRNISALQSKAINDYPSFMKAYGKSEETAENMLKEHPSLQMIFDIHRDADKRGNVITTIGGEEVARIMIIVAQGQADLPQPHWKENYAFAKLIESRLNTKYPGLLKEIQLVDWRYNQHLHPHALLVEVGSEETSTEEAEKAIAYFGEVLADLIEEGK